MASIFSTNDWYVENAPIKSWGFNDNGTFYLRIERYRADGSPFEWTMNVPKGKLANLPSILDAIPEKERKLLRFTGGWQLGNASVEIDDGK